MLHESSLVGAFHYLWGYFDSKSNKLFLPLLLNNAQNPLDVAVGDLISKVGGRYFIIEFKRERIGFMDEVHGASAKPARKSLYTILRDQKKIRNWARFGHFGAYQEDDELIFEPWGHVVGPESKLQPDNKWHELDYNSFKAKFAGMYSYLNDSNLKASSSCELCYDPGLGLPAQGMYEYLKNVLGAHPKTLNASDEVNALFGFVSSVPANTKLISTNMISILESFSRLGKVISNAKASVHESKGYK